jgi:chaperone BCS1
VLSLAQRDLTDDQLVSLLNSAPPNAILVLEDVDAAFVKRTKNDDAPNGVSFSGLLNAIDGVVAQEGMV